MIPDINAVTLEEWWRVKSVTLEEMLNEKEWNSSHPSSGRYGTFLPPKAGAVYKFLPEGEKKIHTALKVFLVFSWLLQFAPGQEWTYPAGRSWSNSDTVWLVPQGQGIGGRWWLRRACWGRGWCWDRWTGRTRWFGPPAEWTDGGWCCMGRISVIARVGTFSI